MKKEIIWGSVTIILLLFTLNVVSASSVTLETGQIKVVEINNREYTLEFLDISDNRNPKARIKVNSDTETVNTGDLEKMSGIYVYPIKIERTGENEGTIELEFFKNAKNIIPMGESKAIEADEKEFSIKVESISYGTDNPRAQIKHEDEVEIVSEGETITIKDAQIHIIKIVREDDEGFVILDLKRILTQQLDLDDQESVEIDSDDYDLELTDLNSDGTVDIIINDDDYTYAEGEEDIIEDMRLFVKTIFFTDDDEGFVILELTNDEENDAFEEVTIVEISTTEVTPEEEEEPEPEPEPVKEETSKEETTETTTTTESNEEETLAEPTQQPVEEEAPVPVPTPVVIEEPEPAPNIAPITGQAVQNENEAAESGVGGIVITFIVIVLVGALGVAGFWYMRNYKRLERMRRGLA